MGELLLGCSGWSYPEPAEKGGWTKAFYLFSLGFYFSAISVSQDIKLRQSIKKYAINEPQRQNYLNDC